jgi:hypothetical protein
LVAKGFATGLAAVVVAGAFAVIGLAVAVAAIGLAGAALPFVAITGFRTGLGAVLTGAEAVFVRAEAALGAGAGFVLALVVSRVGVLAWATIGVLLAPGRPA